MYNAEIRPKNGVDRVCYCDQSSDTCQPNLTEFSAATECASNVLCDTSFNVTLLDYQDFVPYPAEYLFSGVFTDSSTLTDANYDFQFILSDVPNKPVRIIHIRKNEFALLVTGLEAINEEYLHTCMYMERNSVRFFTN